MTNEQLYILLNFVCDQMEEALSKTKAGLEQLDLSCRQKSVATLHFENLVYSMEEKRRAVTPSPFPTFKKITAEQFLDVLEESKK